MESHDQRGRAFVALDGIRGIAALAVVSRHIPGLYADTFFSSYLAVDLFFLLSGFVVAFAYENRLKSGLSLSEFMTLRLIRLYPLYLLGTALALVALGVSWANTGVAPSMLALGSAVAFALLFLPAPPVPGRMIGGIFPLNHPAWSLFFELAVNLVYAIVARYLSTRLLLGTVAGTLAAFIGTTVYFGSVEVGPSADTFVGGFARVGFSFFAGVLVSRVWKRCPPPNWLQAPMWLLSLILLGVFMVELPQDLHPLFELAVVVLVFPVFLYTATGTRLSSFGQQVCDALGRSSYAVYVLHVPVYLLLREAWFRPYELSLSDFGPWGAGLFVAGLFGLSLAADRLYDSPLRAWLNRLRRRAVEALGRAAPPMCL